MRLFIDFLRKIITVSFNELYLVLTLEHEQEILIEKLKDKYTKFEDLLISVHTWNVNGSKKFKEGKIDLFDWLFPIKDFLNLKNFSEINSPDIYLIGFQEIVDLNAKYIMFNSNSSKIDLWHDFLTTNLNKIDK